MSTAFRALVVSETAGGEYTRAICARTVHDLPKGEVLIRVRYSSLNYKDALSATGNRGVTRSYPHIPGIDAAGIVHESSDRRFRKGEEVLVTGYELGANWFGGFSEYIRVPAEWVVKLPSPLTIRESMMYGTAGFTAAMGVDRLLHDGAAPEKGPVLVTGATGGVGSIAVAILGQLGFPVVAATGKMNERQFLLDLGAAEVIHRDEVLEQSGKPLASGRWAWAYDTVGGSFLDSVIRQIRPFGAVAACGNVISGELRTSVYPFILRGVSLLGINSALTPMPVREAIWRRIASEWRLERIEQIVQEVSLEDLDPYIDRILAGGIRGRVLVRLEQ